MPLTWNGAGRSALTTWNIPPAAKLGVYEVVLEREPAAGSAAASDDEDGRRERTWTSGNFRVEEFRLPLVDARLSGPKAPQVAASERRRRRADELLLRRPDGVGAAARVGAAEDALAGLRRLRRVHASSRRAIRSSPQEAPESEDSERDASGRDGKLIADKVALTTDRNGVATLRAEGPAEGDAAAADRRRGDVQRPERRDADGGDADRSLAERARPRRQGRQLGEQPRQARSSASSRSTRRASRSRARASRCAAASARS